MTACPSRSTCDSIRWTISSGAYAYSACCTRIIRCSAPYHHGEFLGPGAGLTITKALDRSSANRTGSVLVKRNTQALRLSSSMTATDLWPNTTASAARCCAAMCTDPGRTSRCCGTKALRLPRVAASSRTIRARSSPWRMRTAVRSGSMPMMRTACRTPATWGAFSTPDKRGQPSSGSTTTRRGCTRRASGGSCRPIRSGMRMTSISMRMSEMIR
jgi:hypothetical protein